MTEQLSNNDDSWTRLKQDIDASGVSGQIAQDLMQASPNLETARLSFELIRETEELRGRVAPDLAEAAIEGVLQEDEKLPYPTKSPEPRLNLAPPPEMLKSNDGVDLSEHGIRAASRAQDFNAKNPPV